MAEVCVVGDAHVTVKVEPGFNAVGMKDPVQALEAKASMEIFDESFQKLMKSDNTFTIVLGNGFETADVAMGIGAGPCAGMASLEQLKYMKEHGLRQIVMARPHPTLYQNAKAVGIDVISGRT